MRDKARVVQVLDGGNAVVIPLITDSCIGCSALNAGSVSNCNCSSHAKPFTVSNRKQLPVYTGAVVKIKASAFVQSVQALFSLIFPITSAVAGYYLSGIIAQSTGAASVSEGMRVFGVFFCFSAAVGIVMLVSSLTGRSRFAFIDEVLESAKN